jgi:membrane fusion protein
MSNENVLPLFRAAARPHGSRQSSGTPISVIPVSWRLLTVLLMAVFGCGLVFLCTQKVVRRETAAGILSLSLGEIRVIPPRSGVLTKIFVKESEEVAAGQRLAYVSTTQRFIDGGGVEGELLRAIADERKSLVEEQRALDTSAPTERTGEREHLAAQRQRLAELEELLPSTEQRLALAERTYEEARKYHLQGAVSGDTLRLRNYDLLTQRTEVQALRAQIAELQGSIARDQATLTLLPERHAKLRAEITTRLAALEQRELSTTGQQGYLIVAEVSGRVTALQARLGQYVDVTKPLMAIAPGGSELQAELYVPSRAIAFARTGQKVRLLYDALPYQQFGAASGYISEISSTVLRPDEIGVPVHLKEPAYRVIVTPDKPFVRAYGVDVPLRSGMSLSADLVLEQRSFMRLLLDPLLAAKGRILGDE